MKALVLEDYNKLVYREFPEPVVGPGEVSIQVKACGICGSDVHGLDGSTGRRKPPLIMGHEASGIILKTGSSVNRWNPGDRVTFDSTVYPLDDWFTLKGKYNLSDNRQVLGVSPGTYRRHGAFAEKVVVPEHILYQIPENVSFVEAAMTEPIAVAAHAINVSGMKVFSSVLVVGAGMVGSFLIQLLKLSGAAPVIAIDIEPDKLDYARQSGADNVFFPDEAHLVEKILNLSNKRGVDCSFEVVGKSDTVSACIENTRKGGTVVLVGNLSEKIQFPLQRVVTSELNIQGSCAINGEYETALNLLASKKLNVSSQISAIAPLSEGAEWFSRLYNREPGIKKVILVPDNS